MQYRTARDLADHWYPAQSISRDTLEGALLLLLHDDVVVIPTDPIEVQVTDTGYLEDGPIRIDVWKQPWICPCMEEVGMEDPCLHLLAARLMVADLEAKHQQHDEEAPGPMGSITSTEVRRHDSHSFSLKGITAEGFEVSMYLRGYNATQLFRQAKDVLGLWREEGWHSPYGGRHPIPYQEKVPTPTPAPTAPQPEIVQARPLRETMPPQGTPRTGVPPERPGGSRPPEGTFKFHADKLQANFLNGRWYWSVFGPDMPRSRAKFGVRIWEEGLQLSGFFEPDPQNPPSIEGRVALYVVGADGRPDKVIQLIEAA